MMTIQYTIGPDQYGGTGIFAAQDIEKGTTVWRRTDDSDQTYTFEQLARMTEDERVHIQKFGYVSKKNGEPVIELNLDEARYFNHADIPNVTAPEEDDPEWENICIASQFIKSGEELTYDYRTLDPEMEYCGAFLKDLPKQTP